MCQGFFDREQRADLRDWKRVRSLAWNIVCGYAKQEDLPANQMEWWPMPGDIEIKTRKLSKSKMKAIAERIKAELGRGEI